MVFHKNIGPFKITYKNISYEYKGKETICKLTVFDNWKIYPSEIELWASSEPKHNDRYDRVIGERVALAKAEKRIYQLYKNKLKNIMKNQTDFIFQIWKGLNKCAAIIDHNINHIKSF